MENSDLGPLLLMRILIPVGIIALIFGIIRLKKLNPRELLAWKWPQGSEKYLWIAGWIGWIAISECASSWLGISSPTKWVGKNSIYLFVTAIGMVLLAPLAEELVFRGILFARVQKSLGKLAAVLIPAILFAALHRQYGAPEMAMILADGLILGFVRMRTGSVPLTFVLHAIGNLVAYLQRFPF